MLKNISFHPELQYQRLTEAPFTLQRGDSLPDIVVAYRTFGELNAERSNVVLVAHALTGSAACDEWWSGLIGRGKILDPDQYFIICANTLGSCYGTTGPDTIDPTTGVEYGDSFPEITICDIARTQFALLRELGITSLYLAIGGSMGGMVLLELALLNIEAGSPITIENLIPIATGANHSAWRIAFSATIRKTIERFAQLDLENGLSEGLRIARQFAMISYRSSEEFNERFGRETSDKQDKFEVESYLEHKGYEILNRFSPQSYITLTRAMELFDLAEGRAGSIDLLLSTIDARTLLVGISSDILYAEEEIRELAKSIPNAHYATLTAPYGHDSFLVPTTNLPEILGNFLNEAEASSTLSPFAIHESIHA
jgi:homoserine O-acetyltransferase